MENGTNPVVVYPKILDGASMKKNVPEREESKPHHGRPKGSKDKKPRHRMTKAEIERDKLAKS